LTSNLLKIANGAGFLGDNPDAPRRLVEGAEVDVLTLEHLAELTMSILARQRQKDPAAGYSGDMVEIIADLVPALKAQSQLHIVTNGGGVNPIAGASKVAHVLTAAGLGDTPIGVVSGDDIKDKIQDWLAQGIPLTNFDTGQPLKELNKPIISANAYLGAKQIADLYSQGAKIIITGRVADASLTLGPAAAHFGWKWDDWNTLAAASVAGHLIECGAQVTGGYSNAWVGRNLAEVGYPIAEIETTGDCTVTKPKNTGGVVDRLSVSEQLIYEIGDPKHYLTPDVDCDFTTVKIEDQGKDRVRVTGATGSKAPEMLKVSMAYADGFMAAGQLLVSGYDAPSRAQECANIIKKQLENSGDLPRRWLVEYLGGMNYQVVKPSEFERKGTSQSVVLRIAAWHPTAKPLEKFVRLIAPLITSGPAGLAGYAAGRPQIRPVYAYWPTLIPRERVIAESQMMPAKDWVAFGTGASK
jgi:hypothetical protein